jgi:predicted aminopeptidase
MKASQNSRISILRGASCALLAIGLCACQTAAFYTQAVKGHWQITSRARTNEAVIAAPETKEKLRQRLRLVQEIRAFAKDRLALPADGQYDRYADLQRRYVVWVVYAAPELSVEAKTWRYPLVGKLKYRGFFNEKAANMEADRLRAEGLDVHVGGVEAYSTLGWFRDPVLNTFVYRDEADLAELIFHELTHQRIFLKGDTDFNEALATANARAGVRVWLRESGRLKMLARYDQETAVSDQFVSKVLETRARLKRLYARGDLDDSAKRRGKADEIARLKDEMMHLMAAHGASRAVERWFQKPVNNARLNTLATYFDLVPAFEALLKKEGGDFSRFYETLETFRDLDRAARRRRLDALTVARE